MAAPTKDYDRVELVWPGKRTEVERVKLPFQVIERVNDVRRSHDGQGRLSSQSTPPPPISSADEWRNKLIWGDNKYVLSSLLDEFAGKLDLIYIDPPFATGADFRYEAEVGDVPVEKLPGVIEELAYRDTWSEGVGSYLQMMYDRLALMRELLSDRGSIFVHMDWRVGSAIRLLLEQVFGQENFRNQIIWHYGGRGAKAIAGQFPRNYDLLLLFSKSNSPIFNRVFSPDPVPVSEASKRGYRKDDGGRWFKTAPRGDYTDESIERLRAEGRIHETRTGNIRIKYFLREESETIIEDKLAGDVWDDIPDMMHAPLSERTNYPTQKPELLLRRVVEATSQEGSIVADFFAGSGTSLVAAEKLNRRWLGVDLGRFAIQTARKRLLDIPSCRPFEVLNLGRYERRYWQGIETGQAVHEYYRFILSLYGAQPMAGFRHLHGECAGRFVHVGATDSPVTHDELRQTLEECTANGLTSVDVLGWEWEMGLNPVGKDELAAKHHVDVRLFHIPREVMDKRTVDAGDVHFFELSVAEVKAVIEKANVEVELTGFLPAVDEYMRGKVNGKVTKWSDWIDYWSVDFEFDGETFLNQWQAYRTRGNPKLTLHSDPHQYDGPGERRVVVKVIDIFGNDTTHELGVTVES